ncbi:MAG: MarR family transcriptional regulator [Actinomycetaceae bacterium]|nr:MarR family transcriptional regulator [Actinomycetaceae bacterium]MDY5854342.1 MarR family transcriptional regulator [Arcanobacterium sp.]
MRRQHSDGDWLATEPMKRDLHSTVRAITAGDDVDTIVTEWEVQRPDFDARPLAVFSRLLRLGRHLDHLRRTVFAHYGLESWQFEMLTELRRKEDYQLTAGQLMQKTLVSSGTITNRIDRLEHQGLVQRVRDPNDGRVVIVQATEKGISIADRAMEALLEKQRELLAPYEPQDIAIVTAFLRSMLADLDAQQQIQ